MFSNEQLLVILKKMWTLRKFEEKAAELFTRGIIRGSLHTGVGQEAVAMGVNLALNEDDFIQTTHRGHCHVIGKGADIKLVMAELCGRYVGYNKGKGGSMHVANLDMGILGANGIVGGGNPVAVGAAFSAQYRGTKQVAVSFFGDGASNQGTFHESINLAGGWKLPIIFVNENNQYAISTPFVTVSQTRNIADRGIGYGIEGVIADGMDLFDVYEKMNKAVEKARNGGGPTLLECKTYRFVPHSKADREVYRTKEEVNEWKKKCPIKKIENILIENGTLNENGAREIENDVKQKILDAVDFALKAEGPPAEELFKDVYYEEAK
ncbi:MAG: thiamine pyrophosphate-dependent dehydrogenase E1 component subunit alpha [Sedimentibacter sp.]|uniref:thiamine pyrophosphate-dependent dehydrogenase E1 component subunit alpha n=1 Tax=Sedimentibacter sp. TaxID=1960295 RepID=UPI00315938A5